MKYKHSIRAVLGSVFLLLLAAAPSQNNSIEKVTITMDKSHYKSGQPVLLTVRNQSEQETYIWIGPCSFTLESHNGDAWEVSPTPWSGCPLCGYQREVPHPLFLGTAATENIEWDQQVTWCEESTLRSGPASGRLRFIFNYAEDAPGCRSAPDPLECWEDHRDKKWERAESDEFRIE